MQVAVLQLGQLGLGFDEQLAGFFDLRQFGHAADAHQFLGVVADLFDLFDIGFELHALALRLGDLGVNLLKLFDDDVLFLVKGDRFVLLFVGLELALGLLEFLFELGRFLLQEVVGHLGNAHLLGEILAEKFFDEGRGQIAGQLGIGILHGDFDEAGEAAEFDRDFLLEQVGQLDIAVGFVARRGKILVLFEIVGLDHAHKEVAAGQRLDDGIDVIEGGWIVLANAVDVDHLLLLLLHLEDGAGFVDFRRGQQVADGGEHDEADDKRDDPPAAEDEVVETAEVEKVLHAIHRSVQARMGLMGTGGRVLLHGLKEGFGHGDDVAGLDVERGAVIAAGHALGVELDEALAASFLLALDRDASGIGDLGVASGHTDGLQEGDLVTAFHVVGAGLLHLAEDGEELLRVGAHRKADLRINQVSVAVAGFDFLGGGCDGLSDDIDRAD